MRISSQGTACAIMYKLKYYFFAKTMSELGPESPLPSPLASMMLPTPRTSGSLKTTSDSEEKGREDFSSVQIKTELNEVCEEAGSTKTAEAPRAGLGSAAARSLRDYEPVSDTKLPRLPRINPPKPSLATSGKSHIYSDHHLRLRPPPGPLRGAALAHSGSRQLFRNQAKQRRRRLLGDATPRPASPGRIQAPDTRGDYISRP